MEAIFGSAAIRCYGATKTRNKALLVGIALFLAELDRQAVRETLLADFTMQRVRLNRSARLVHPRRIPLFTL